MKKKVKATIAVLSTMMVLVMSAFCVSASAFSRTVRLYNTGAAGGSHNSESYTIGNYRSYSATLGSLEAGATKHTITISNSNGTIAVFELKTTNTTGAYSAGSPTGSSTKAYHSLTTRNSGASNATLNAD